MHAGEKGLAGLEQHFMLLWDPFQITWLLPRGVVLLMYFYS